MESKKNQNLKIKAILLGESGVGKTNLINVAAGHKFEENSSSTYINSFVEKVFINNKQKYILQIWDTIGQEKFRPLTRIFFKDAKIVIFVYDKSDQNSYKNLKYWTDEVTKILGDDIIKAIVGNKADLDEEEVDENEAREFAKSINSKFKMTSAKKDSKGFIRLLNELLDDYLLKSKRNTDNNNNKISLDTEKHKDLKKNGKNENICC